MSYTTFEPAAVKFYFNNTNVFQIWMSERRLYVEPGKGVKVGVGITNPTTAFDVGNYIFLKDIRGMTESMSFQLTNPGYGNEPYSFVPIGTIIIWGGTSIPENWVECNGQAILQIAYPLLYQAIGYTYTSTVTQIGNTTLAPDKKLFEVPDFRGGVAVIQRKDTGTGFNSVVGGRYPNASGAEKDVDIETDYIPLRNSLIQEFVLKSNQLPPHKHQFRADKDINGNPAPRNGLKAHSHTYYRSGGSINVTVGGRNGVSGNGYGDDVGAANFIHTHDFTNARLLEAYKNNKNDPANANPTWNNPFSIEQQYVVMKYLIKAG